MIWCLSASRVKRMNAIDNHLNDRQKEAVFCTEGPLLILAGAGSGKTRVLMHRIAYLIEEKHINPYQIMAITFTNKAAKEMRERVDKLVGLDAQYVWVMTFHSSCVRILRREIERLNYSRDFSIYDTDDQKTLIKKVCKELGIDTKQIKERNALSLISAAKNELIGYEEFRQNATGYMEKKVADIYEAYQKALHQNNALDFDDLIGKTVELFEKHPDILDKYQERFRYIMVDEYQDTNTAQFRLISLLADKYRNICVVGDDDQSIYGFRGANIENILNFDRLFPHTQVIKLEQNYRSDGNILAAANGVIQNNLVRRQKKLWTQKEEGAKIRIEQYENAVEEANQIIREIKANAKEGNYNDFAILYRTNAQSRLLEERCVTLGVPYQLVGGVNFYQRKEIKDILAYLKTVANGSDDIALLRIMNVPKRGIGNASIQKVSAFASANGLSLYEAIREVSQIAGMGKAAEKFQAFSSLIEQIRQETGKISTLIERLIVLTGYKEYLSQEGEIEAQARWENIEELINKAADYTDLSQFLEDVALIADVDRMDENEKRVTLMTLHAAKGLEFPYVYLTGMEDGLFPGIRSIASEDRKDLEEERRLCYVGITRAKKKLCLTAARMRMINGETRFFQLSRFAKEIPNQLIEQHLLERKNQEVKKKEPPILHSVSHIARPSTKPSFGKEFKIEKAEHLEYIIGDRVKHMKFGEGTVLTIEDGERDYTITVEFDQFGIKKMMAGFAKLIKI